ncbi:MAG: S-layer homology domain-containing protein [Clostridia bacterium]|nr:S-layer homology domain-containing protein [Clostridia bacterium]
MKKLIAFFMIALIVLNNVVFAYDEEAYFEKNINKTAGYLPVSIGCDISNKSGIAAETRITVNTGVPQGQNAWNCYWLVLSKADGATMTFNSSWSGGKGLDSAIMTVGKTYIVRDIVSYGKEIVRYIIDEESNEILKQTVKSSANDDCKYTSIKEIRMSNIDSKPLNVTVLDFKVYDISLTRESISIEKENVRTDEDILVTFNTKLDSGTIGNVFLYDSENNKVDISIKQEDKSLIISPVGGLRYNTKYTLKLSDDLKNEQGVGLIEENFEFTTEQPPYRCDINVSKNDNKVILSGVIANLSPYEKKQGYILSGYNAENELIFSDIIEFTIPAECGGEEALKEISIENEIFDEIKTLKLVSPSALKSIKEAEASDVKITKGYIDRVFSSDRYVYFVEGCDDDTEIILNNAQLISDDDEKCVYEIDGKNYIFNKIKNKKSEICDISFVDDNTVLIKTENATGEIIITRPKEKFSQDVYSFSELIEDPNEEKLLDLIKVNGDETEYTFSENAETGAYGFIIDDNLGGVNFSDIYYTDKQDLKDSLDKIKEIKNSEESIEKKIKQIQEFILDNEKLIKLDLSDYSTLLDKGFVCEYILNNEFEILDDFIRVFNTAKAIALFNQAAPKYQNALKYKDILQIDAKEDIKNVESINKIIEKTLSDKKAQNVDEVKKVFYNAYAIERVNEADRQTVLKTFESGFGFINISEEANSKYNNTSDKANIITALVNKGFLSDDDISNAIINAPDINSNNKNTSGGGVSSGGGKKSSVPAYIPLKIENNENKNEEKKQEEENKGETFKFSDVSEEHWAYNSIMELAELRVINGKEEGIFAPSDEVLREEFVKMLVLVLDIDHSTEEAIFSDCPVGSWYNQYVCAAVKNNIVNGIDENNFGKGRFITRQDMAVMLYKAIKAKNLKIQEKREYKVFSDDEEIMDYAKDAVKKLYSIGLINGMDSDQFNPQRTLTRAMAAEVLNNLSKLLK